MVLVRRSQRATLNAVMVEVIVIVDDLKMENIEKRCHVDATIEIDFSPVTVKSSNVLATSALS